MTSFLEFAGILLCESNTAGQKFEQRIAKNVKKWISANNLEKKFKAQHYQASETLKEDDGRAEDYSDIVVENLETTEKIFIECKEKKANFVTTQFNINKDGTVTPVAGKNRDKLVEDNANLELANMIQEDEGFQNFIEFLWLDNDLLDGLKPAQLYYNDQDVSDKVLNQLMNKYNKFLKTSTEVEADCKPFDSKLVREKTRNMLACGLCWRLGDPHRTWDICTIKDIQFFSELVKAHYANKKIPAKYIQIDDDLFILDSKDNPLGIKCTELPNDLVGRFDLKFTPRFGTGSMYVTPRSKLLSQLKSSNSSFKSQEKWPFLV